MDSNYLGLTNIDFNNFGGTFNNVWSWFLNDYSSISNWMESIHGWSFSFTAIKISVSLIMSVILINTMSMYHTCNF